jgi:hypothetical protein
MVIETKQEVKNLLNAGMEIVTKNDMLNRLNELGYKISPGPMSFNYTNVGNTVHYEARSIYLLEADTGISAFNVDARRDDKFKALQDLISSTFVYDNGRIWEM